MTRAGGGSILWEGEGACTVFIALGVVLNCIDMRFGVRRVWWCGLGGWLVYCMVLAV